MSDRAAGASELRGPSTSYVEGPLPFHILSRTLRQTRTTRRTELKQYSSWQGIGRELNAGVPRSGGLGRPTRALEADTERESGFHAEREQPDSRPHALSSTLDALVPSL